MSAGQIQSKKRRGRKPKGGKLTPTVSPPPQRPSYQRAVLLHLKCVSEDLVTCDKQSFEPRPLAPAGSLYYSSVKNENKDALTPPLPLSSKLANLSSNLRSPEITCKRGACFWCTGEFSSVPVYIPKTRTSSEVDVYGNFCSPECAASFLFNENNLDESTKFERYHLLCSLYADPTECEHIKLAPSPYYLLDRFMGDLSCEEYREIHKLKSNVLVVDKPLTASHPEVHIECEPRSRPNGYTLERNKLARTKKSSLTSSFGII